MSGGPYDALATALSYPREDFASVAERSGVAELAAWAASVPLADAEELYTRLFDLQAPCSLDVGWHLFGETYQRGPFLVKLRVAERNHGVDAGTELPDHLGVVLRLLGRLGAEEEPLELVEEGILPALSAMAAALSGDASQPYRSLLSAIDARLRADFGIKDRPVRRLPVHRPSASP